MRSLCLLSVLLLTAGTSPGRQLPARSGEGPVTMAQLNSSKTAGVSVAEVSDYAFGGFRGEMSGPPHADLNPGKAFVIYWKDFPYRFVFSHEASYCPWFELPSGAGVSFQMWEGNEGWAELFNEQGRRERNSFVDIIEAGPRRVWVRWTYFGVNLEAGEAAYRATEDFWAFPNGLILRRQSYRTLKPGDTRGYAREPIELIVLNPVGMQWWDVLARESSTNESHAFVGVDAFSRARVDIYWKRKDDPKKIYAGTARRTGSPWKEIDDARGFAGLIPLRDGSPFFVIGDASGFPHETVRLKEHGDRKGTGGWGWGTLTWDHWPVGWLNSQSHDFSIENFGVYPSHFAPFGLDLWSMKNEETENRDFYSLVGVAGADVEAVRTLAKNWLSANAVADPARAASLKPLRDAPRRQPR